MRPIRSLAATSLTLTLGFALIGCGGATDNLPREAVSGKVTFEGEPIARGAIMFRTASGAVQPLEAGGLIRDGKYQIPRAQGPIPGSYAVMITEELEQSAESKEAPGIRRRMRLSRVSAKYNARTELSAQVRQGDANSFDFDLKKANDRELATPNVRRSRR